MTFTSPIEDRIRAEIIYTALKNDGAINENAVFGVVMKHHAADLKARIPELRARIKEVADEYRGKRMADIEAEAAREGVEYEEKDTTKDMVELEVDEGFRVRIPPEPSKHLHVGHALSFLINAVYAERYDGEVVLRFEDTNPQLARQEYVDSIRDDVVNYLRIEPARESFASDEMDRFYDAIVRLLEQGDAYVCTCDRETMSQLRQTGGPCEHREAPKDARLAMFENMRSGVFSAGEAVVRLAGDMTHKNAAMRDPVLARISEAEHYRHGREFRVWPLYDLENPVMDAAEGITHVLRDNAFGEMRAELQREVRSRLGLRQPRVHQYGRFVIEGAETSGRKIREGIAAGEYAGWDDPRLATLKTMKRRGFRAATFRDIAREVGLSPSQTRVDVKMLAKYNRRHVDRDARRYSFVFDPVEIDVEGYAPREVALKSHPESEERDRSLRATGRFLLRREDAGLDVFRLMEAGNVERDGGAYRLASESIDEFRASGGSAIVNWLPAGDYRDCAVVMPDGSTREGLAESSIGKARVGDVVQLERFGFCRIDAQEASRTVLWFAHA